MDFPLGIKKSAVLCVLKSGTKLLLLKRLKEPNRDKFTPIGGKLEPFESPMRAAIRETQEESGILLRSVKYCGAMIESSPVNYNWINFVYAAEVDFMPPPVCNEGELQWIDAQDIPSVPTPETDRFIYKYVLEGKTFSFNAEYDETLKLLHLSDEIENEILYRSN